MFLTMGRASIFNDFSNFIASKLDPKWIAYLYDKAKKLFILGCRSSRLCFCRDVSHFTEIISSDDIYLDRGISILY